jgi:broad specificity phosphatase PhoE
MLNKAEFYFIRHGETDWNFEGRCMGQKDIPLNDRGISQAIRASSLLQEFPIKSICYSPLLRTKRTAEIINKTLNCPMIEIDALKECCWGTFEGELKQNSNHLEEWIVGNSPKGAEDYKSFIRRALNGINEALKYPVPLIVSHGGVYWAIQNALGQSHKTNTALQNCVAYYHKPIDPKNSWQIEALESCFDDEPFET